MAVEAPQVIVVHVQAGVGAVVGAGQLVGPGQQDEPVHRLHRPAAFHKTHGQPVAQFRMRRRFATSAEVIWSLHQARAKVVLPNSIDHDSRGQRVVGRREPISQLTTPTASVRRDRLATEHAQKAAGNGIAQRLRIAAQMHAHIMRLTFGDGVGVLLAVDVGAAVAQSRISGTKIRIIHTIPFSAQ